MGTLLDLASLVVVPSGYKEDVVYSVKPTDGSGDLSFTRSNDTATRVNSAGLIEKVRTNLVLYSEEFNNAAWTKAGVSVTANSATDPFGTSNADVVVENAVASTQHRLLETITIANGVEHTTSLYVKRIVGTRDFAIINIVSRARVYFNLTTGAVGTEVLGTGKIENVGNGWYRCSATGVSTGTSAEVYLSLTDGVTAGSETYSGDGVSSLAFYGAQFETGVLTDYIPTTSAAVSVGPVANVPRLDYSGGGCPKLLLEPQRTNLVLASEQINNNTYWTDGSSSGTAVVTANYGISPDGYQNAERIQLDAGSDYGDINQFLSVTNGTAYTYSVYLKSLSGTPTIGVLFNGAANITQQLTTEWVRYSFTFTGSGGFCIPRFLVWPSLLSTSSTADILVYGAQLEAGSYVSSYIPTLSAAVTRGADACFKTGISSLIGQTEGTLFLEMRYEVNQTARLTISDGTGNNWIFFSYPETTNNTRVRIAASGIVAIDLTSSAVFSTNQTYKIALGYKSGSWAFYINGSLMYSGTQTFTFNNTLDRLLITGGTSATNTSEIFGKVSQTLLFPTRLTNTQLAELTTL